MKSKIFSVDCREWMLALSYLFLQTGNNKSAIIILELLLKLNDIDYPALKMLSYAYYSNAQYEQAFNLLSKLLKETRYRITQSDKAMLYLLQAKVLLRLNRKDLAKKCMTKYGHLIGSSNE